MKNKIALKISLIYFLIGFIWILFSDLLILQLGGTSDAVTTIQTYKGWFFVGVTAVLLFLLVRDEIRKKNLIENDLIKAKTKAEESDNLKSAFLSNISHQIRTPLNGILGFCELILDDSFNEDDKQVFAKHMSKNGNDLLKMINDIMDISKIQENQFEINCKQFNLNSLLDVIYIEYQQSELKSTRNRIDFKLIKGDNSEVEIFSDPVRLTHVFQNLLNNAFSFTQEGFIHFGYELTSDKIVFFVADSGIGIEESTKDLIFKPFFKGIHPVIGKKGFGLGLAISKGLVRLLGGELQYTSTVNGGTRFFFPMDMNSVRSQKSLTNNTVSKTLKMRAISLHPKENKLTQN